MGLVINWTYDDIVILSSMTKSKTAYRYMEVVLLSPAMYALIDGLKGRELERIMHRIPCQNVDRNEYNELIGREQSGPIPFA